MPRGARALAIVALGLASVLSGGAAAVSAGLSQGPAAVPGELIVGFEARASRAEQNAALGLANASRTREFLQIRAALVRVAPDRVPAAMRLLRRNPDVRYVQPNYVVTTMAVPNDPSFAQLWGLDNTGQTGGTPDADVDAPEAWDLETGSSEVVVAVSDTGVDFGHPDLAPQQWVNPGENCGSSDPTTACAERSNGIDDDVDGLVDDWRGWDWVSDDNDPFDDNSHGTHVAGTIGAVGNNGAGVSGVNWNVKIMPLKFLNAAGSGSSSDAIAATLYAADHGASVASNSWGGGPFDQALLDAIEYGAARGMLFVAAAGNDARDNDATPTYPATYESDAVLSVAATDHDDALASFSSYGRRTVDLGAPGVNVFSTTPGGSYGSKSGTSMATPHVSGAAALVKAHFPGATPYGIKTLLLRSVDPKASLTGRTATGGRLNLASAVSCSDDPKVVLAAPLDGFGVGVGDSVAIRVLGADCASPAGLGNVSVTVNGVPVTLSAASPDSGVYTGTHTVDAEGSLTVTATVTVGGTTDAQTVTGSVARNYACVDIADTWIDATPGANLGINLDSFKTIVLPFPFTFYGQTYTTVSVSSHGFLAFGSSAGSASYLNTVLPNPTLPNGLVAPFWDDLNPGSLGRGTVYGGWRGTEPNRDVTFEWHDVPHTFLVGSATFEVTLYEATGEVRFRYLDTDFGDSRFNFGASATAGVESPSGTVGRQYSFNQPVLTNGKAISCAPAATSPPLAIATSVLDDGTTGEAYSELLSASGGTPPYAWSIDSGAFPPGVSLDATSGAVTGTPTATGSYAFTARVTDSASRTSTKPLAITVAEPLAVLTTSLPGGTVAQPYSQVVQAAGGATPYVWSTVSGSLPPGLDLSATTGEIAGTPTAAGTFAFVVRADDAGSPPRTDTQALSIVVAAAPAALAITTTSLPDGRRGISYSATLAATGGMPPYAWSLASGGLPPGLSLSASGVISGVPTKRGSFTFTVRVTDAVDTQRTRTLSIRVRR